MGDFDFAKPDAKKGAKKAPSQQGGKAAVPKEVVKAVAKKADKKGGSFDPSVFLDSGVPSRGLGPTSGGSPTKKVADTARSRQQARQKELRGKTMKSPYPGA